MSAGPRDSSTGGYLVPTTPLPLDDEILHRRISNLIAGITGLPGNLVRPRWQPNPPQIPAPETNWVAVGVVTYPSSHGTPVRRHISDGDGYDVLDDPELIRLLASFYGPNCGAYARLCRHALWVEQNWEQLAPLGLSLSDAGDIAVVGEDLNETWYRRADLPITLAQDLTRTYMILNILRADGVVHAQYASGDGVDVKFDTNNVSEEAS
jgi:hypothetical protein